MDSLLQIMSFAFSFVTIIKRNILGLSIVDKSEVLWLLCQSMSDFLVSNMCHPLSWQLQCSQSIRKNILPPISETWVHLFDEMIDMMKRSCSVAMGA